tara:strand:- start:2167 stop:2925 length:759 start_codon:yes stop_codon:yes gene_type:complete
MKKETTLLIDGDIFAYRHAAGAEEAIDWGNDWWTLHTDMKVARSVMDSALKACITALNATKVRVALSHKENFRRDIDPEYKASRKKARKPIGLPALREHLMLEWRAIAVDKLEADDLLGIWATDPMYEVGARKIIVSTDKDMQTIPCELWNPNKPEQGVRTITKEFADDYHLFQTLCGDSTDGYAGCPSVGPTTARRILDADTAPTGWEKVVHSFGAKNLSEKDALVQARLARILRIENYDMRKGTIKYWEP